MITPVEFARRMVAVASDFVGLEETKDNAEWDDPRTAKKETDKSTLLLKTMARTGWSPGQPYCAGFAGAVVVLAAERSGLDPKPFLKLWTPHCMTNVRAFRKLGILDSEPSDGSLMLMRHGSSDNGHAGLCVRVDGVFPNRMLATIEGNTMPGNAGNQRQGDGVYARARNVRSNGDLSTQGWVSAATILKLITQP
jgi:hypothetical protein